MKNNFTLSFVLLFIWMMFPLNVFGQSSTPYSGVPWPIPGIIEIEDFDLGGEGVAYHDSDSTNNGGKYRTSEGVDIGNTEDGASGQYEVGWASAGEWLKYTVNVTTTGTYKLIFRGGLVDYATGQGEFHLEIDGVNVTGTMKTYKGLFWWQGYCTITVPGISLTAGIHTIKLVMDKNASVGVGSLNFMYFELSDPVPVPIPLVYPQPVPGKIFYVSPVGNDTNPGTLQQPWKTISKATQSLNAGETAYIREGTYKEMLVPARSGEVGEYIIYMAYPGEVPVLDGSGIAISQLGGLVNISGRSYIRVSGLKVTNSGAGVSNGKWNMGISVKKSDHVIIDQNTINHTYSLGIDINQGSSMVIIDGNEISDSNFGSNDDEVGLGMFWFSNNLEIKNNLVHHTKNEGIGAAAGPHDVNIHHNEVYSVGTGSDRIGIYIDAWTEHEYNITVNANRVHDNVGQGIVVASEGGGLLENVDVINNLVYRTGEFWGGMGVAPWSTTTSDTHPVQKIKFVNNTVFNNTGGGIVINNPEVQEILIRNNIFYQNTTGNIKIDGAVPSAEITQDHNLTTDPQFINPNIYDFHLKSTSPAIDKGSSIDAPNFDYDNYFRPAGTDFDIGAYEYGSTIMPSSTPSPSSSIFPTPSPILLSDADSDGDVDIEDLRIWFYNFPNISSAKLTGDFNSDSKTNLFDFGIWIVEFLSK